MTCSHGFLQAAEGVQLNAVQVDLDHPSARTYSMLGEILMLGAAAFT
jgi:hypothetical protein